MRLWTIHPRYLDSKGLVAAWREGLLAQKVLAGKTRGYTRHPQLLRFRNTSKPGYAISAFLSALVSEAEARGYHFDKHKITHPQWRWKITETRGQLDYEWVHLLAKLRLRAPDVFQKWSKIKRPAAHPLFRIVSGPVRDWEKQ